MEKKDLDLLLMQSLTPDNEADESLNQAIFEQLENPAVTNGRQRFQSKKRWQSMVPKVAAVVLAVLVIGTGTVYAAGRVLGQVFIRDHRVSVGNESILEHVSMLDDSEVVPEPVTVLREVTGGPEDKWIRMDETTADGTTINAHYYYADYRTLISDTPFENVFSTLPGTVTQAVYGEIRTEDREAGVMISVDFQRGDGHVIFEQMGTGTGFWGVDAISVRMTQSGNTRTYRAATGTEYTLVDDLSDGKVLSTVVMIQCEGFIGYLEFEGLTEQDIHQVLDSLIL